MVGPISSAITSAIRALAHASHSSSPIGRAPFSPAFRDGDHAVRSIIGEGGEGRGLVLATRNAGSSHGSIFPFSFLFLIYFCPLCRQTWPRLHLICPCCLWTYSCTSAGIPLLAYLCLVVSDLSYALITMADQTIVLLSFDSKGAFTLPQHHQSS